MKRIFCLLIGIVLLSCSCSKSETTSGYASNRHQYDKETRIEQNTDVPISDMMSRIIVPEGEEFR